MTFIVSKLRVAIISIHTHVYKYITRAGTVYDCIRGILFIIAKKSIFGFFFFFFFFFPPFFHLLLPALRVQYYSDTFCVHDCTIYVIKFAYIIYYAPNTCIRNAYVNTHPIYPDTSRDVCILLHSYSVFIFSHFFFSFIISFFFLIYFFFF